MGNCSKCGKKAGFLSKNAICIICGKELCGKCLDWMLYSPGLPGEGFKTSNENPLCSIECSKNALLTVLNSLKKDFTIELVNADNSGVEIHNKKNEIHTIYYMKGTPQDAERSSMMPEVIPLYSFVKEHLEKNHLNFTESKAKYV
jgi:hypothetical protein